MSKYSVPLQWLADYFSRSQPEERGPILNLVDLLSAGVDCLDRFRWDGHIVASAWVVSPDRRHVLLAFHAKLDRWMYLGGHADGVADLEAVALREVREESGLETVRIQQGGSLFDFDVHAIPAHATAPAHQHFDFRFLVEAEPGDRLRLSPESKDLRWLPIADVAKVNSDFGIPRLVAKTRG